MYHCGEALSGEDPSPYRVQKVDVPLAERVEGVLVIAPTALLAQKVIAYRRRQGKPKAEK